MLRSANTALHEGHEAADRTIGSVRKAIVGKFACGMKQSKGKILVISGVFPPARIAEADHALHMSRKLAERGFSVDVLTRRGSVAADERFLRVHAVMSKWNWSELPRLVRVARQCAPDVVFIWFLGYTYNLHPMMTFAPTILKRALANVPVVTQITYPTGYWPQGRSPVIRGIRKLAEVAAGPAGVDYSFGTLLRDSDQVVVMAPTHLKNLSRSWPQVVAKSTLIPPPPLLLMSPNTAETRKRGREALHVASEDFVFAYFGRLYKGKGVETLLEAFRGLSVRHPNAKLVVIGGPPAVDNTNVQASRGDWRAEDLYAMAVSLGIQDRVVWTGEFPWDSQLGSTYLRAADVAVLPFDGGVDLNNSSFAAVAAHGLATITTRGDALEDLFLDRQNVFLCPPCDPAAMTSAMAAVMRDGDLKVRLETGIEALARAWFSWEASVDKTVHVLEAAMGRRAGRSETGPAVAPPAHGRP